MSAARSRLRRSRSRATRHIRHRIPHESLLALVVPRSHHCDAPTPDAREAPTAAVSRRELGQEGGGGGGPASCRGLIKHQPSPSSTGVDALARKQRSSVTPSMHCALAVLAGRLPCSGNFRSPWGSRKGIGGRCRPDRARHSRAPHAGFHPRSWGKRLLRTPSRRLWLPLRK